MKGNDVDDHPRPIVKVCQAHECPQLRLDFCNGAFFEDFSFRCDDHAIF